MATSILLKNSGSSTYPFLELQNNNSNSYSGEIRFIKKKTASDNDQLGLISFQGYDDVGGSLETYGQIKFVADDVSNTTEDGKITYSVATNGSLTQVLSLTGTTATFNDNISLNSDGSIISMGLSSDITFTHDGVSGLTIAANPITLDSASDIILDAAGNDIVLKDNGTVFGYISNNNFDLELYTAQDKDILLAGNDGGSKITALKLDMSDAGTATFNNHIQTGSEKEIRFMESTNYVGFKAPTLTGDQIWTLPNADGSSNQVLKTNGSGVLSWATQSGGGSSSVFLTTTSSAVTGSSSTVISVDDAFSLPNNSVITRIIAIVTSTINLSASGYVMIRVNKENTSTDNILPMGYEILSMDPSTSISTGTIAELTRFNSNSINTTGSSLDYGIDLTGSSSDMSYPGSPDRTITSGTVKCYVEYITFS